MNNSSIDETTTNDDGIIEFIAPAIEPLVIIKASDSEPVARPSIIFSDELIPSFILGETDIRVELTHLFMIQQAAIALLAQGKREVLIMTPDLEHERLMMRCLLMHCLLLRVRVVIPKHEF